MFSASCSEPISVKALNGFLSLFSYFWMRTGTRETVSLLRCMKVTGTYRPIVHVRLMLSSGCDASDDTLGAKEANF